MVQNKTATDGWVILACVVFDTLRNRRLHPVFLCGAVSIVAFQSLRLMLAGTDVWIRFAAMSVGLMK